MGQVSSTVKIAVVAVIVLPVGMLCGLLFVFAAIFGGDDEASAAQPAAAAQGCGLQGVPNGWGPNVEAAAQVAGVDPAIGAAQLEKESSWNPNNVGPPTKYGTAKGLAQFIDSTWAAYGSGSPFDPIAAIEAWGKYMAELMQDVEDLAASTGIAQLDLALAAYNAGPGAVQAAGGIPSNDETSAYVPRIKELAAKYAAPCSNSGGAWTHPLPGAVLTSAYRTSDRPSHAGLDLATPRSQPPGTEVAVTSMKIMWAGCRGDGYGCSVVATATDGTGYGFRYGHMAEGTIRVSVGQTVAAGTPLGVMGNTGDSRGAHLHFEIYRPGFPPNPYASSGFDIDPRPVLAERGVTL